MSLAAAWVVWASAAIAWGCCYVMYRVARKERRRLDAARSAPLRERQRSIHAEQLDAFVGGFLLEHGWKSASRYPLSGLTSERARELLLRAFNAWQAETRFERRSDET